MIIKLKCDDEELVLTNEQLNNDNFVDLVIGEQVATVSLDELLSAVAAFEQIRCMENNRE